VNALLAPSLVLEVLDRVGEVCFCAIDPGFGKSLVKKSPGGPDKRAAAEILFVTRLLADEEYLGAGAPLAKDGL
jgi:hypothetical protein